MSRLLTTLRTILLDDPAAIERVAAPEASRLAALLEANRLEPVLYRRIKDRGDEQALAPERFLSWKMAHSLAVGRSLAFGEALRHVIHLAGRVQTPVRLLRGTQLAFFVYPAPELRPLARLEIQTPPERASKLHYVLKLQNFVQLESLAGNEPASGYHLPEIVKDGVAVRICLRSAPNIRVAPWDPFSESARNQSQPRILRPAALLVLLASEAAGRRFCHSLLVLHDIHVLLEKHELDWSEVARLAVQTDQALETFLALRLARDLFDEPVSGDCLRDLEAAAAGSASSKELLATLSRTAACQYPAPPRLAAFVGHLLDEAHRRESSPSAV